MTEQYAGTFHLAAAQVDTKRRRIVGLVVPYGEVGNPHRNQTESAKLRFEAGGLVFDDPHQVKLVIDHPFGGPPQFAGRARDLISTSDGLVGTFSIVKTYIGDQALAEAADGLRTGLSFEGGTDTPLPQDEDGTFVASAEHPLTLTRVALVESPAFASSQVHEVAASRPDKESTMAEQIAAAEVPDDQLAEVASTLGNIAASLKALVPAEEDPADEAVAASRPAKVPAVGTHMTASTSVKREPFPYGHPGAEGKSFFADQLRKKDDSFAAARVAKAEKMWEEFAAADEAAVQTDVTVPNVYQDALLVNLPPYPRDIADNVPSTPISSARPILVPVVDAVTADGGSGEVVGAHVENTNPAAGEIDIDYDTYTPALYSGKFDISREAVDAGSPGMDELLFGFLRRSYAVTTEAAAYTAIAGYSGIDTGSSTTDASAAVEAANMVSTIITEAAAFKGRLGAPADIIWAHSAQFANLTGLNATDGRPILPYQGPMNTVGTGVQANYGVVAVQGIPMYNAAAVASTKVLLARRDTLHRWESPLLSFRWEEVAGPAKIRFVAAGYFLTSVLDARGVCLITQA